MSLRSSRGTGEDRGEGCSYLVDNRTYTHSTSTLSPVTSTFTRAYTPESGGGRSRADSTSTRRSQQYDSPSSLEARRRKTSLISDRSFGEGARQEA